LFKKGRSRWIVYNPKYGLDYDGSQIDPEWHPWIHYMTDEPPTVRKPVNYKWVDSKPQDNKTGSVDQYVPYTTTKPKVEAWIPNSQRQSQS
jgi:NADH dehydrogenase (ubiquinone) 1 alpha subcomplex subunit 12